MTAVIRDMAASAGGRSLTLRRVEAAVARAQTMLARRLEPLTASAKGTQILATLDMPRDPVPDSPWLSGTLDGSPFAVQLPWGVLRRIAGEPVEGSDAADGAVLVEAGLEPWLEPLEVALGIALRFDGIVALPGAGLPVAAGLALHGRDATGGQVQMRQAVVLSVAAAERLAEALSPRRRPVGEPRGLELRVDHGWPPSAIDMAALATLVPGDAVLLEHAAPSRVLVEGQLQAPVETDGAGALRLAPGATFTMIPRRRTVMPDETGSAVDPATLDEVEVALSFRAGGTTMAVGALRALSPGAVIETTDAADAIVEIAVNDRVVGTGELIDVGGRRAVQVRSLFAGR